MRPLLAVLPPLMKLSVDRTIGTAFVATQAADAIGVLEVLQTATKDALGNVGQDPHFVFVEDRQALFDDLVSCG